MANTRAADAVALVNAVRRILRMHTDPEWTGAVVKGGKGQMLAPPVAILSVRRVR